jgi:hypothetical protein
MLGARIGGAYPFGAVQTDATGEKIKMKDFFGPGGGLEIQGGVRFAKYFTGKLIFGAYAFAPGDDAEPEIGVESENSTLATSAGIGFQAGTPRGEFGGFGEANLLFHNQFQVVNDFTAADCKVTQTASGSALGLGGGLSIPLSSSFALTPVANIQFGQFDEVEFDEDCGLGLDGKADIDSGDQELHGMVFLGLGFEFLFGSDKP